MGRGSKVERDRGVRGGPRYGCGPRRERVKRSRQGPGGPRAEERAKVEGQT